MATQGPFAWLDLALAKMADGTINMTSDTFKAVLCTTSQAIDETFVGASGDARYADLTAELTTANGYTAGGLALTSVALSLAAGVAKWTADPMTWTLTGSITFKYLLIYSDTATNKDLLCFCDMDTGGGSVSPTAGTLQVSPSASGILGWSQ